MIWDIENELHLTTLSGSKDQDNYNTPKLRNNDKNLMVLHENGIDFWQLINPVIKFEVKQRCKLARMYFLQDSEHIMMVCDDRYFYLLEVDTFRIIREFPIPQGGYLYNLQPNGDILVAVKNLFFNSSEAKLKKSRLPKTYRNLESVQEIESIRQSDDEDSEDLNPLQKEFRKVLSKNKLLGSKINRKLSRTSISGKSKDKMDNKSINSFVAHYHTESEMIELAIEDFDTNGDLAEIKQNLDQNKLS